MSFVSTTLSKHELSGRRLPLLRRPRSLWTGHLLRESFWKNRGSIWSRRWRKGNPEVLGHLCDTLSHVAAFTTAAWGWISQLTLYWCFVSVVCFASRLQEMEILYKKEKEEADLLLEQQRLVGVCPETTAVGQLLSCLLAGSHWCHT